MGNEPLQPTGLVCRRCNRPYGVIEADSPETFDCRCLRCGYHWTVIKFDRKP